MTEFKAYPKTPRLFRDVVITEKIDGTNAAIQIEKRTDEPDENGNYWALADSCTVIINDEAYAVTAQSRKRIITPTDDNFGFAKWVYDNAHDLVLALGEGVHFGEWWGSGIQSGYGLPKGEKRFSLFNVGRWADTAFAVPGLGTVPVLYEGPFSQPVIDRLVDTLKTVGSRASQGHKAEGIVVFHTASRQVYKVLCENDEIPKGLVA